jgi:hypothetical protein
MAAHGVFAIAAMMLAGYLSVEVARWRQGRESARPRERLAYPATRLVLRSASAGLLLVLLWLVLYWKALGANMWVPWSLLALLLVLVIMDLRQVWGQYQRERERREQEFFADLVGLKSLERDDPGREGSDVAGHHHVPGDHHGRGRGPGLGPGGRG